MLATSVVRFTIPVTSPVPVVVADAPMVRVFITEPSNMSRLPLVAVGFELCKFSTPFIDKSLGSVMPPVPLMVRLLTFPEKTETGSVMAAVLVKAKVAPALLALIVPLVLTGELPEMARVLAPRVNVPFVSESVAATFREFVIETIEE